MTDIGHGNPPCCVCSWNYSLTKERAGLYSPVAPLFYYPFIFHGSKAIVCRWCISRPFVREALFADLQVRCEAYERQILSDFNYRPPETPNEQRPPIGLAPKERGTRTQKRVRRPSNRVQRTPIDSQESVKRGIDSQESVKKPPKATTLH